MLKTTNIKKIEFYYYKNNKSYINEKISTNSYYKTILNRYS